MANAYKITCLSVATDGTNIFVECQVYDGSKTLPIIRPVFEFGTSRATILAYLQQIANNQPAIDATLLDLVGLTLAGA